MLRNKVFRGVQRIPGGRDYILQMKYKPVPRYTDGFVLPDTDAHKSPLVGRAFPQPLVQTLDGTRLRLDDVLGSRIAIIGVVGGVVEALSPEVVRRLAAHNAVVIQAHVPSSYRRKGQFDPASRVAESQIPVIDVYDHEGGLRDLYLATPADEVYVVRPDRYVAAVSSVQDLNSTLERLLTLLEET